MPGRRERGSAALEVALAVPVILLFLISGIAMLSAMSAKLSAVDSAGFAVRAVARGEPVPELRAGTELIGVVHDGDVVRVTVRRRLPTFLFADFYVEETAVAMAEPHAGGGP